MMKTSNKLEKDVELSSYFDLARSLIDLTYSHGVCSVCSAVEVHQRYFLLM